MKLGHLLLKEPKLFFIPYGRSNLTKVNKPNLSNYYRRSTQRQYRQDNEIPFQELKVAQSINAFCLEDMIKPVFICLFTIRLVFFFIEAYEDQLYMIPARLPTRVKQAPKLLPTIKPNKNPCIVASESTCCVKLGCCII